jgi:alpha-ketoglutarate-dependent taurine dioxygenase
LLIGRHAYGIPGLDDVESAALLDHLVEFACQPPRVYHHDWTAGDAAVWDNRCLLHRACPWDMTEARVMYHSRIGGDPVSERGLEDAAADAPAARGAGGRAPTPV